jgi:hypothetical protein
MATLLEEIERLEQREWDPREQLLLKMCANLLESYHKVKDPKHQLTEQEYFNVPGRWELVDGMLCEY